MHIRTCSHVQCMWHACWRGQKNTYQQECLQSKVRIMGYLNFTFWLLFIFYCSTRNVYYLNNTHKSSNSFIYIYIYIYVYKILSSTSGRTLRPGTFQDTLSTALEEAPGPRTLPCQGPYLRSLRPLSAISAQAALLCLLIRWGLNQRWRESWPLESVWRKKSHENLIHFQSHANGWLSNTMILWKEKGPQKTRSVWPLVSLPLTQAG